MIIASGRSGNEGTRSPLVADEIIIDFRKSREAFVTIYIDAVGLTP